MSLLGDLIAGRCPDRAEGLATPATVATPDAETATGQGFQRVPRVSQGLATGCDSCDTTARNARATAIPDRGGSQVSQGVANGGDGQKTAARRRFGASVAGVAGVARGSATQRAPIEHADAEPVAGVAGRSAEVIALSSERLQRVVRARLDAHVALLAAKGYDDRPRARLLARARRDIAARLGYRSLTAARAALGDEALMRAAELLDEWAVELAEPDPYAPEALFGDTLALPSAEPVVEVAPAPEPPETEDAALRRGRRLLDRLRWTERRVWLEADGQLMIRPRLGTADPFGQAVAAHPDDIARALAAETAEVTP